MILNLYLLSYLLLFDYDNHSINPVVYELWTVIKIKLFFSDLPTIGLVCMYDDNRHSNSGLRYTNIQSTKRFNKTLFIYMESKNGHELLRAQS